MSSEPLPPSGRRAPIRRLEAVTERKTRKFGIRSTFKLDLGFEYDDQKKQIIGPDGQPLLKERDVLGYEEPTEHTPAIDEHYEFPLEETMMLLLGLTKRDNVLLVGDTGTGKTSLVEQVAARLNYNVIPINFDGYVQRQDLVGEPMVKAGETFFQYGLLIYAMQLPGTIILLDEWDALNPDCGFVFQRPLDKNHRKLILLETGGEIIRLHPDNCFMATANTCGQGDESGLYAAGTRVQNYSHVNRFAITIRTKYLPADREIAMLMSRFPMLEKIEATTLVQAAGAMRTGHTKGEVTVPLSPRDLINWTEKFVALADPLRAAKYCFLNRMTTADAATCEQIVKRAFVI